MLDSAAAKTADEIKAMRAEIERLTADDREMRQGISDRDHDIEWLARERDEARAVLSAINDILNEPYTGNEGDERALVDIGVIVESALNEQEVTK